jgi:hypothetical protein
MYVRNGVVRMFDLSVGIVAGFILTACSKQSGPPAPPAAVAEVALDHPAATPELPSAAPVAGPSDLGALTDFDGISIGTQWKPLHAKGPYAKPCSSEALEDEPRIRAWMYTGLPCEDTTFVNGTSVVVFVDARDKVVAFGWMAGTYGATRNASPVTVGAQLATVTKVWGEPVAKFPLGKLKVARFKNGVRVLTGSVDQIVGAAVGSFSDSPTSKRWYALDVAYGAYTDPVPNPANSYDFCKRVSNHVFDVSGDGRRATESDIAHCRADQTPEQNQCVLDAKTDQELGACFVH